MKSENLNICGIDVCFIRKKIKNMNIRITADGTVTVSAPIRMPFFEVERFVFSKKDWILSHRKTLTEREFQKDIIKDGGRVRFRGEEYPLLIKQGKRGACICGENMVITAKADDGEREFAEILNKFYRRDLKGRIERLLPDLCEKTGLYPSAFGIKNMKTRWGSCNTKTHKIWLALSLARYNDTVLCYVLTHELIHIKIKGHGADFKAELSKFCPTWKTIKKNM